MKVTVMDGTLVIIKNLEKRKEVLEKRFGLVSLHINLCRRFNAKAILIEEQ